ncbi:SDR family NAD(P)-dependent oxidoreductase [Nocardioides sp. HDW12B]|uniref:SDR family NAD(P)-dependent oxidoreductase n=1 Tax=Nocardioides sp. HDW12B TaxID=2714939 RepID=UPI00140A712F|nr:SDR family NAD(P)-dependent oxidoreductase [Nocardioides sp. HDW12B]QIK67819.1 SDR family NAD(P)-dependent oxidoreductase [Nocardioides sp. HDW12B]
MVVLVTGGTGFVGSWTARALADAGHEVRFLVRTPEKLARAAGALGVNTSDTVVGDITDAAAVRRALAGCQAVVHCAAVVAVGPGAAERMERTNLAGARHVVGEAVERGLRAVHVSSIAALSRPGLRRLTADLPVAPGLDAYGASKAAVDGYVRELAAQGAPVDLTYPTMVMGPPAGEQVGEGTEGVAKAVRVRLVPGREAAWNICDVRDLGRVHAAIVDRRLRPARWVAGGVHVRLSELVPMLAEASGRRLWQLPVPDGLLRAVGRAQDRVERVVPLERWGLRTPLTAAAMEYYTRVPVPDNGPVERELGVTFRDPAVTLRDAVAGLRELGRL